jgi:RHS repeat-associated protein
VTLYAYDSSGNRIREQQVVGTQDTLDLVNDPYNLLTGNDLVTTWEFATPAWNGTTGVKVAGLPSAVVNPRGYRTEYTYTTTGMLQKETIAVGTTLEADIRYEYDSHDRLYRKGNELSTYDVNGNLNGGYYEQYEYDGLGRLTKRTQIDPDGAGTGASAPFYTYTYDRQNRLKTVTDPINRVTLYTYETNGSYSQDLPNQNYSSSGVHTITQYLMDAQGRLSSTINPHNVTTSYAYDGMNRLTDTTLPDPDLIYTWNSSNSTWNSTNGSLTSAHVYTSYDALSRTSTTTDANGNVTEHLYSNYGRTVELRSPSPGGTLDRPVTISEYDAAGNLTKTIEGSVAYNAALTVAATALRWTRYEYDDLHRLVSVYRTQPGVTTTPTTNNEYLAESYTYDRNGNRATESVSIDITTSPYTPAAPLMRTTTYEYDQRDRLDLKYDQDPDGASPTTDQPVWDYTYDVHNRLIAVEDAEDHVTNYGYDRLDRLITTTLPDPDGSGSLARPVYSKTYDAMGRVVKDIDPLQNYTLNYYNALDDEWQYDSKDAANNTITITKQGFDALGRMIHRIVSNSTTSYAYDSLDRLTKVTYPDPDDAMPHGQAYTDTLNSQPRPYTLYEYDAGGNRTHEKQWVSGSTFLTTVYAYDDLDRVTSRTDPAIAAGTPVTSYTYDVFGNQLTLTDPSSNGTTWQYDLLDRATAETNQLGKTRYFQYDLTGNLTKRTDPMNRVIAYTYDRLGRNTQEAWSTTSNSTATFQYDFGYDRNGRLKSADGFYPGSNSYASQHDYAYNAAGWLETEDVNQPGFLNSKLTTGYDVGGRRTSLKSSFAINTSSTVYNDFHNEFGYDAKNRLDWVRQQGQSGGNAVANKYIDFAYNTLDQVIDTDRYAATTVDSTKLVAHTDYERDYMGRLKFIDHLKGATSFARYDFTYDNRSRITQIDDVFSNSAWNETHDYTYDDTDQLTAADHSVQNDEAYAYDANGNRTGNQTHLGATTSSTVTTNNRITTDGVYHYEYDDEGNRNKRITLVLNPLTGLMEPTGPYEEYTYDHRNRLDQITYKSSSGTVLSFVRYRYDHNNLTVRRIENMYTNGVAGTNTYNLNVHDGNQIVSAFIRGATGGTKLSNRYLWGPQVDQLLSDEQVTSMTAAGTTYWALENQLNSVVDLVTYNAGTDTTSVAKHRAYDSFGNVVSDSARGVTQVFGFTGKMLDAKTGLQWNINRWYDAKLGQWISEDPIGFAGGDESLRRYVGNHPTYATDPNGLDEREFPSSGGDFPPVGDFGSSGGDFGTTITSASRIITSITHSGSAALSSAYNVVRMLAAAIPCAEIKLTGSGFKIISYSGSDFRTKTALNFAGFVTDLGAAIARAETTVNRLLGNGITVGTGCARTSVYRVNIPVQPLTISGIRPGDFSREVPAWVRIDLKIKVTFTFEILR